MPTDTDQKLRYHIRVDDAKDLEVWKKTRYAVSENPPKPYVWALDLEGVHLYRNLKKAAANGLQQRITHRIPPPLPVRIGDFICRPIPLPLSAQQLFKIIEIGGPRTEPNYWLEFKTKFTSVFASLYPEMKQGLYNLLREISPSNVILQEDGIWIYDGQRLKRLTNKRLSPVRIFDDDEGVRTLILETGTGEEIEVPIYAFSSSTELVRVLNQTGVTFYGSSKEGQQLLGYFFEVLERQGNSPTSASPHT